MNSFVIYFQQMFDLCAYFYAPTYSDHMKNYHLEGAVSRKSPRKPALPALMCPQDLVQRGRKSLSWCEEVRCHRASN